MDDFSPHPSTKKDSRVGDWAGFTGLPCWWYQSRGSVLG